MVGTSASDVHKSVVVMRVTGKPVHLQLLLHTINKYSGMFHVDFTFSKQAWLFMQSSFSVAHCRWTVC